MTTLAQNHSLFDIDQELDLLLNEIQDQAEVNGTDSVAPELIERFQQFCHVHTEKVDRIGHFLKLMEARANYCREQAARLSERARSTENKVERTKNMVIYYLESRGLPKVEGLEFTLRMQKNSHDSVVVDDEVQVPIMFRDVEAKIPGQLWLKIQSYLPAEEERELDACIREMKPNSTAIKAAIAAHEVVPGARIRRGFHLRVA